MKKPKRIEVVPYIVLPIIFFAIVIYNFVVVYPRDLQSSRRLNKWYREYFNYSFTGIVTNCYEKHKERGNRFAILELELLASDVGQYPPDTSTVYFCRINNGKAKVMIPIVWEIKRRNGMPIRKTIPSDTLTFDGARDKFILHFDGDTVLFSPRAFSTDLEYRRHQNIELDY